MLDVIVVWVGVYDFVSWWLLIVLLYFVSLCVRILYSIWDFLLVRCGCLDQVAVVWD